MTVLCGICSVLSSNLNGKRLLGTSSNLTSAHPSSRRALGGFKKNTNEIKIVWRRNAEWHLPCAVTYTNKEKMAVQEKFHISFLTFACVCFHMSFFISILKLEQHWPELRQHRRSQEVIWTLFSSPIAKCSVELTPRRQIKRSENCRQQTF